jgi:hypothetical protein
LSKSFFFFFCPQASEYAKYYFDLRESSTEGKFESVKPLTTEQGKRKERESHGLIEEHTALKLEQNSLGLQEKSGGKQLKRTMSAEQLKKESKPVILN